MCLVRFLVNFAVFCLFWWISRDFVDLLVIHSPVTTRNKSEALYKQTETILPKNSLNQHPSLRWAGTGERFQMWSLTLVLPVGSHPSLLDRSISSHYSKKGSRGKQGVHMLDHSQFFQVHPVQMAMLHFWCLCWRWQRNTSLWEGWHLECWASCNPHKQHC